MNVDSPIAADLIGDIPFIVDVFEDQNRLTSTQYEINLENEYWPKLNSFEPKTLPVVQNGDRYFADHNGFSVWCFDEEIVCYSEIKVLLTFPIRTKAPLQFYNYYVALQIENNDVLLHDDHTHKGEGANEGPCNVRPNTLNDYLYQNNNEYCDHLAKHTEIIGIPICGFDFGGIENQISIPVNFEAQQQNQAR